MRTLSFFLGLLALALVAGLLISVISYTPVSTVRKGDRLDKLDCPPADCTLLYKTPTGTDVKPPLASVRVVNIWGDIEYLEPVPLPQAWNLALSYGQMNFAVSLVLEGHPEFALAESFLRGDYAPVYPAVLKLWWKLRYFGGARWETIASFLC